MCRVLAYLGNPILLDDLLYKPDNSLIKQTYAPRLLPKRRLNLAGFGMAAWNWKSYQPLNPYIYKTTGVPFYEENLKILSNKINANALLAHVRGVSFNPSEAISLENTHPFKYPDFHIALAHNGNLSEFPKMRYSLLKFIPASIAQYIRGSIDSEWIYALLMSQFKNPTAPISIQQLEKAVLATFAILQEIRYQHRINTSSPVNLFISNGEYLLATRFIFDYGRIYEDLEHDLIYNSLWYTYGEKYGLFDSEYQMQLKNRRRSVIFASEPLTANPSSWIEIPEYSMISAWRVNKEIQIKIQDIKV